MPDPREAVYDVLLAKQRRLEDERRLEKERGYWERYEATNRRAHGAYRPDRGP